MARTGRPKRTRRAKLLGKADRFREQGAIDRATQAYRQLLRNDPDDAEVHFLLGTLLAQEGHDEGLSHLERAVQLRPRDPALANNLGHAQREAGRLAEAEATFATLAALDPGPTGPYGRATVALARNDPRQALGALQETCRRDPSFVTAWRHLGTVHQRLGRPHDALQSLTHAVALAPRHAPSLRRLGLLHAQHGRPAVARATLRQALALAPDDAVVRHMLAALDPSDDGRARAPEDAYVAELFDAFADDYDDTLVDGLHTRVPELVLAALGDRPLGRVADLGCGTGLLGASLRERATELVGVDLSPKMLDHARDTGAYDALHHEGIDVFLGRTHPPFDTLVLADVLVYVGDLRPLLPRLHATLVPGGQLVATTEAVDDAPSHGVVLRPSGRYAHHDGTISEQLETVGFDTNFRRERLRREGDDWVIGTVWQARRAPGTSGDFRSGR